MIIQHNIPAINSHRQLGINNNATAKNLEKLSSGFRINRAGDDAAGLAISEKMRGQIRGLAMAEQNCENGISLIQTAEGGLNETHAILQRMRELAVQASNGTYDDEVDRANINKEVEALKSEIDRIAASTHYNGIYLLDGTMGGYQVNSNSKIADVSDQLNTLFGTDTNDILLAYSGELSNSKATGTLVISEDKTISLTVGDKTYAGTIATSGANTGAIEFKDKDGATVATLTGYKDDSTKETFVANSFKAGGGVVAGLVAGTEGIVDITNTANPKLCHGVRIAVKTDELVFQIGANGTADQQVGLHVDSMSSGNIGGGTHTVTELRGNKIMDIDLSTRERANESIAVITAATNQVSGTRADLGALQNRLEHTLNNLGVTKENLTAAESTIRDVDMAKEMMEFTKNNILVQASQAMLAQANQLPQGVLQLLR